MQKFHKLTKQKYITCISFKDASHVWSLLTKDFTKKPRKKKKNVKREENINMNLKRKWKKTKKPLKMMGKK